MQFGNAIESLHQALGAAIYRDLPEITYEDRDWNAWKKLSSDEQKEAMQNHTIPKIKRMRRLLDDEVEVYMFPQTWGSTALGYGGIGGAAISSAYTIVVTDTNTACVYFGCDRLAYKVVMAECSAEGRERFYSDLQRQHMADVNQVGRYK